MGVLENVFKYHIIYSFALGSIQFKKKKTVTKTERSQVNNSNFWLFLRKEKIQARHGGSRL